MESWLVEELSSPIHGKMLEEEEKRAVEGKYCTKYLHSPSLEPKTLASMLDVLPDNQEHPEKFLLQVHHNLDVQQGNETTFRIQGYLVDFELPPIIQTTRLPRNLFWAKQRVRITGLGSPNFFKSIRGIKTIHEVFNRHIPASSCQEWNYTLYEEHPAVDFQCSYFAKDGDEFAAQFPKNVDPFGILTRAGKQKGLRISTDCLIEYYERTIEPSGDQLLVKHNTVDPAILRRGHLVEVTMAFQLIRTKRGKWLMLAILRSIEVLSRHIDEMRLLQRLNGITPKDIVRPSKKFALKRRREYEDEEVETTRKRFNNLELRSLNGFGAPKKASLTNEKEMADDIVMVDK